MRRGTLHIHSRTSAPTGVAGRIVGSVFFLVFGGMGTLLLVFTARSTLDSFGTHRWTPTPCVIEHNDVRHDAASNKHVFEVRYSYTHAGVAHTGTTVRPGYTGDNDAAKAYRLQQQYPVGAAQTCRVNPASPGESTLQLPSLWGALMMLFPLPFMAVGFGGLYVLWRPRRGGDSANAISSVAGQAERGKWLAIPFFGIFALAGFGFLIPFFILPALRIQQSKSWPAVPCTILSSQVRSHSSSDGTTYSVDIRFEYEFDGRTYQSSRYDFSSGSSSGRSGKQAIVDQYRVGTKHTCYVNPAEPYVAVIHRGWPTMMWFALIPLVFVFVGVVGMVGMARSIRRGTAMRAAQPDPLRVTASARSSARPDAAAKTAGAVADWLPDLNHDRPAVLQARRSTAIAGAIFLLLFGAVWNGIVWTLLVPEVLKGWRPLPTGMGWIGTVLFTLFGLLFVLVGAALVVGFLYTVLKSFNPLPRITVNRAVVPVGGVIEVAWELLGKAERVRQLTVTIEGVEKATYRRGTNTTTDEHVFITLPVADADADLGRPLTGKARVVIPVDTVHSFKSNNNEMCWQIRVRGVIRMWPDVNETFPIAVVPPGMEA
jgi:hypothetical protein